MSAVLVSMLSFLVEACELDALCNCKNITTVIGRVRGDNCLGTMPRFVSGIGPEGKIPSKV